MADRLDTPRDPRRSGLRRPQFEPDAFGRIAEAIARFMGTPRFLLYMTVFVAAWLGWNTWLPIGIRFDSAKLGFTALTLMLSLQASYSAPLILLAQNRQTDRDRVAAEQDRQRAARSLADTEFLAREIAALRIALGDVATRDYLRSELRDLVEELTTERMAQRDAERDAAAAAEREVHREQRRTAKREAKRSHDDADGLVGPDLSSPADA